MSKSKHRGTTTGPIRLPALAARLRDERLRAAGIDVSDAIREPTRLTLTASARRHLAAVLVFLTLALFGAGAAFTADQWRNERNTTGYVRACISCHGRMIEVPPPSATP